MSTGADLIAAERLRQITAEGWTPAHDAALDDGDLALAAATYATPAHRRRMVTRTTALGFPERGDAVWQQPETWPWAPEWWKPCPDRVRELVKAGALIAAEIDRLLRKGEARHPAGASTTTPPEGTTQPSGPVPGGEPEPLIADVLRTCEAIGYGRVMQVVSDRWREVDPRGAFAYGPCYGSLPKGIATPLDLLEAYEAKAARLADAEIRVALWSGAPVEGWDLRPSDRYTRAVGDVALSLYEAVRGQWEWCAYRGPDCLMRASDPDPLVCLRAAEAWLSEVPRG